MVKAVTPEVRPLERDEREYVGKLPDFKLMRKIADVEADKILKRGGYPAGHRYRTTTIPRLNLAPSERLTQKQHELRAALLGRVYDGFYGTYDIPAEARRMQSDRYLCCITLEMVETHSDLDARVQAGRRSWEIPG